jgi:hypothetical protein
VVGLRDQINQKPAIASMVVGGAVLLLLVIVFAQLRGNRSPTGNSGAERYYTIDDGRTWFADAWEQIPPFDHEGSPAVLCHVFKTSNSAPFAGYLEQYTQAAHDQLTGAVRGAGPVIPPAGVLVKRPGDKTWVPWASPAGQKILAVKSPDGSAQPPQPVYP